jgi:27-O-demethylrifamycin SV methyltransferase
MLSAISAGIAGRRAYRPQRADRSELNDQPADPPWAGFPVSWISALPCPWAAGLAGSVGVEGKVSAQVLVATWRERGLTGLLRKIAAAASTGVPLVFHGRRTARSVGAYFDLITDEARRFYGDSFHLGYFGRGDESLADALHAHTDLVAGLARIKAGDRVLDVGCGIGEPASRIVARTDCKVVGVNISREQVRQGRELVAERGLSDRIELRRGDARTLEFPDASFDAVLCMEVGGDICVADEDKAGLIGELRRVLRPGGHVGFSDLAMRRHPTATENRTLRAVLYHSGSELVTDWPAEFAGQGFRIREQHDIIRETLPTWTHAVAAYEDHRPAVIRRYGERVANRTLAHLREVATIIATYGSFPAFSAEKIA